VVGGIGAFVFAVAGLTAPTIAYMGLGGLVLVVCLYYPGRGGRHLRPASSSAGVWQRRGLGEERPNRRVTAIELDGIMYAASHPRTLQFLEAAPDPWRGLRPRYRFDGVQNLMRVNAPVAAGPGEIATLREPHTNTAVHANPGRCTYVRRNSREPSTPTRVGR
jgi:hypothetical protein